MKIKLKDIEPNPYRDLKRDPIRLPKVARLAKSIKDDMFWGGLHFRPHPTKKGKYQSAFGHNRIAALRKAGETKVESIVREITDDKMVELMIKENRERWDDMLPAEKIQNVRVVRDFLRSKGQEIGRNTILKYFQDFPLHDIRKALIVLDAEEGNRLSKGIDKEFPNMFQLDEFVKVVEGIPKSEQKKLAKETAKMVKVKKVGGRQIPQIVDALTDDKLDPKVIEIMDNMDQVKEFQRAVEMQKVPKAKQQKIAAEVASEIKMRTDMNYGVSGGRSIAIAIKEGAKVIPKIKSEQERDFILLKREQKEAADAINNASAVLSKFYFSVKRIKATVASIEILLALESFDACRETIQKNACKVDASHQLIENRI